MMAPRALLQNGSPPIRVTGINHVTLRVSDVKRPWTSIRDSSACRFISRQGNDERQSSNWSRTAIPGFSAAGSETPNINHICLGVDNFNVDRIIGTLRQHGITKGDSAGPMKVRVRMRGPEAGGAKKERPSCPFGDPDGIVIQLQDPRYCGGAARSATFARRRKLHRRKGCWLFATGVTATNFVSDGARSNKFYRIFLALTIQAYQGPGAP